MALLKLLSGILQQKEVITQTESPIYFWAYTVQQIHGITDAFSSLQRSENNSSPTYKPLRQLSLLPPHFIAMEFSEQLQKKLNIENNDSFSKGTGLSEPFRSRTPRNQKAMVVMKKEVAI